MMLAALALLAAAPGPAESATRAAIARVDRLNPIVNAVIALDPDAVAQARALDRQRHVRGPLFGMPVLVKDNIETVGTLPTTAGSLALAANVTHRDAPLVANLRAAGAVILGKTNLSEWANFRSDASVSGWSGIGGQTRNPYALDRSPCGSSSGSAVAVASGMVDAAIGTETDGSITCPAAMTGIVGLKPTVGLVSRSRIVPISASQDTAGPMTKDVTTAARLLTAIAGTDPADSASAEADAHRTDYAAGLRRDALTGQRIGVLRAASGGNAQVRAVFDRALAVLRARGAILVDIATWGVDREALGAAELTVLDSEFAAGIGTYLATADSAVTTRTLSALTAFNAAHAPRELGLFGQEVFERALHAPSLFDPAYLTARATARRLARDEGLDRLLSVNRVVALVAPTAGPAFLIDAVHGDSFPGGYGIGGLAAVAGYPHLTVPMGEVRSLPVGLSFVGPPWSEAALLGLGYAFEQARGPRSRPGLRRSVDDSPGVAPLLKPVRPATLRRRAVISRRG